MRRIVHALAAVTALAALPLTSAHADDPFACNGSPEISAAYVCIVRFQAGVDPVVTEKVIAVPAQSQTVGGGTVSVPAQSVGVPGQPVHVPAVCAGPPGFCVGPFDMTTPPVNAGTPAISQRLPSQTVNTPGISQAVPLLSYQVAPGAVTVLFYDGTCYYVWPDGSASKTSSSTPNGCP